MAFLRIRESARAEKPLELAPAELYNGELNNGCSNLNLLRPPARATPCVDESHCNDYFNHHRRPTLTSRASLTVRVDTTTVVCLGGTGEA